MAAHTEFSFTPPAATEGNRFDQYIAHPLNGGGVLAVFAQWAPAGLLWRENYHFPQSVSLGNNLSRLVERQKPIGNARALLSLGLHLHRLVRDVEIVGADRLALLGYSFVAAANVLDTSGRLQPFADSEASGTGAISRYDTTNNGPNVLPTEQSVPLIHAATLNNTYGSNGETSSGFTAYLGPLGVIRSLTYAIKKEPLGKVVKTLEAQAGVLRVTAL